MSSRTARPKSKRAQEAFAAVVRAADRLQADVSALLKARGISGPQYNVLRILRGAGPEGLPCQGIADRMITRVPDITRLIDRLLKSRLVVRRKDPADRRVVRVRLAPRGESLLAELDDPIADIHKTQFKRLRTKEIERLVEILGVLEET